MFGRFLFAIGLSFTSAIALADDMTLLGVGNGGGAAAPFTAPSVVFQGSFVSARVLPKLSTTSALSGVSAGPTGLVSFWSYVTGDNTGQLNALVNDVMGNNSSDTTSGTPSSESTNGFNIIFDNASRTFPSMTPRLNLNTAAWDGQGIAVHFPQFGLAVINGYPGSLAGSWVNWIMGWDATTANAHCAFMVRNGTLISTTPTDFDPTSASTAYNYANSAGFTVGPPAWNSNNTINGGLGEVYVNFSPSGSVCSGNAPVAGLVAKFYSGTGNPVDLGANCASPGFGQPAVCLRGNLATATPFTTNQGSGGTLTAAAGLQNFPTNTLPTFPADNRVHQRWVYIGLETTTAANTPFATDFGYPAPAAGDLIVLIASKGGSGTFTNSWSTPTGYTPIYSFGGTANYGSVKAFYKISTGSETAPSLQATTANSAQAARWTIIDYGNVNQSTPIGANVTTQWSDANGNSSCAGFTPSAADSLIVFASSPWKAGDGPYTLSSASMQTRMDQYYVYADGAKSPVYLADMQNVASTVVPTQTLTYTTIDAHGCGLFEIEHN